MKPWILLAFLFVMIAYVAGTAEPNADADADVPYDRRQYNGYGKINYDRRPYNGFNGNTYDRRQYNGYGRNTYNRRQYNGYGRCKYYTNRTHYNNIVTKDVCISHV